MPRLIETDPAAAPITLGDLIAHLDGPDFDPADEESFAGAGPWLHRLSLDRSFLADLAVAELARGCRRQSALNRYSAQVILLHRPDAKYFIRANFWPALTDSVVRASGTAPFFYHVPHDHNFSFLTVGYLGPGYWSDYYEYDHARVAGSSGEPVDLRFVERSRLDPHKTMLYRRHRDVHRQLPADALSVSLNIMESSDAQPWLDQYRFDIEKGTIDGILTATPAEALLGLAAHLGGGAGVELALDYAARHPSDRLRFAAIAALASADADPGTRRDRYAAGTASASRYVRAQCRAWLDRAAGDGAENDP